MAEELIKKVLNYLWATSGKVDPEKFAIGVDWKGWAELGATDTTEELTFLVNDMTFYVIPLEDMPDGTVALVWREEK